MLDTHTEIQIRPLHDRVLVRKLPEQPRIDGLILIRDNPHCVDAVSDGTPNHDNYSRVPLVGVIVAVGPGVYDDKFKFHPTIVKPGEIVIFSDWNDWEEAPGDLYMIREGDVWGYPKKHDA